MSDVEAYEVAHGDPFDWNLRGVRGAWTHPPQSVQRHRRSQAQCSVENRWIQRLAGVGVQIIPMMCNEARASRPG